MDLNREVIEKEKIVSTLTDRESDLLLNLSDRRTRELIINRPEKASRSRRIRDYFLTILWWSVWIYLCLPLATILLWVASARRFSDKFIANDGLGSFLAFIPKFAAANLLISGSLVLWALYNWGVYSRLERRKERSIVPLGQIADDFGLTKRDLLDWSEAKVIRAFHDADGHFVRANVEL